MASAKQFYLFFLVFLFSSASLQIHARDSQFFSKFTRVNIVAANNNNNDDINNVNNDTGSNADNVKETVGVLPNKETPVVEVPAKNKEIPASSGNKKDEKPNKQVQVTNSGYGLYGHGSGQFPPTTNENDNNEVLDAMTYSELPDEENFGEEFSTTTPAATGEGGAIDQSKTTKDGHPYYNKNNGYDGKQFGLTDAQFTADNVDTNHYHNYNKHNHDEQQLEKQGMSDTRFLANGKYFYHVEAANPNADTRNDEYYKHISGAEFIDQSAVQEQNEGSHYGVADRNSNNNNNNNGYEGKQFGLSDAQFSTDNVNNNQNNNNYEQQIEKEGMGDTRFVRNGQRYDAAAVHNNNKYQPIERQGMSDTRFQENGRYYNAAVNFNDNINNNNNMYQQGEKQGMSDTRFLANGKYYYHVEAANHRVNTHNDENYKHIDGAEFIDHSADSSRFNNQQQQQHINNGGYYNYGTNNNNNGISFDRQYSNSNSNSNNNGNSYDRQYSNSDSNNNGNSFDRQYSNSNSNSNYYPVDREMNTNNNNNVDDDNQLGPQGKYIP